jgi:hypothetical protein
MNSLQDKNHGSEKENENKEYTDNENEPSNKAFE